VALAIACRSRGWSSDLPLAAVVTLTAVSCTALVGPHVGFHPLGSVISARLTITGLAVAALLVAQLRLVVGPRGDTRFAWAPALPAASMALVGVVMAVLPVTTGTGWILAGDNLRHIVNVAQVQAAGGLDYATNAYPRAWHSAVALAATLSTHRLDGAGVLNLIDTTAGLSWLLYAVLTLTAGLAAADLAQAARMPAPKVAVSGLVGGSAVLWPQFAGVDLAQGFQTSVLGCAIVLVSAREVSARPGSARAAAAVVCGLVLLAHTWQLLLAPQAVLLLITVSAPGARTRVRVGTVVAAAATIPLGLPALTALSRVGGVSHAAQEGWLPDKPVWISCVVALAGAAWCWTRRRDPAVRPWAAVLLTVAGEAMALMLLLRTSVDSYYIQKLLRVAVLLAIPAAAVGSVAMLSLVRRRWPRVGRSPALIGAGGAVVVACLLTPVAAPTGVWTSVDPALVLNALATPGAATAQVVWLPGREAEATTVRMLMDVYHPSSSRGSTPQVWLPVSDECGLLLRPAHRPEVLSSASEADVRARYACVPETGRVPVR
jgi:hypothetical protein